MRTNLEPPFSFNYSSRSVSESFKAMQLVVRVVASLAQRIGALVAISVEGTRGILEHALTLTTASLIMSSE